MDNSQEKVARLRAMQKERLPDFPRPGPGDDGKVLTWIFIGLVTVALAIGVGITGYLMRAQFAPPEPAARRQPAEFPREQDAPKQQASTPPIASEPKAEIVNVPPDNSRQLESMLEEFSYAIEAQRDARSAVDTLRKKQKELQPFVPQLVMRAKDSSAAGAVLLLLDTYAIGSLPDAAPLLARHLNSPIDEVRREAFYAFASLEGGALPELPTLLAKFRTGTVPDRQLAAWVLAHLISRCGNLISNADASRISETLADVGLQEKDNEVRETAAYALVLLGPREPAIIPRLVAALGRTEAGTTSKEIIGKRYLRAAILQFGKEAWPALISALKGELGVKGNDPRGPARSAQEILLSQGTAPLPAIIAALQEIRDSKKWQDDPAEARHMMNILGLLAEIGPAAEGAVPVVESWGDEESTVQDALARMRLSELPKLVETIQLPSWKTEPRERRVAMMWHNEKRIDALAALERAGPRAVQALPALKNLLADDDMAIRYCALRAIGKINPKSSLLTQFQQNSPPPKQPQPVFQIRREDPYQAWLRADLTDLIRQKYDRRTLAGESKEKIEAGIRSEEWMHVQEALIEVIERGELEAYLPLLMEVFPQKRSESHDPIGRMIVEAFVRLGAKARPAIPVMLDGLESHSERYVRKALILVAEGAPDFVPKMKAALAKEQARCAADPQHGKQNQIILAYLLWKNSKSPDAMAALVSGLRSPENGDRERAVMLLGEIGPDASTTVSLIIPSLQDLSPTSRLAAIQALEKIGPGAKEAVPPLRKLLADRRFQVHAAHALIQIAPDDPAVAGDLAETLKDLSGDKLMAQIKIIAQFKAGAAAALPVLRRLTTRGESTAAGEAAVTIWKIEQTPQSLVALLRRFRTSPSLAEVGPPAKVAVVALMPQAICKDNDFADESTWKRAQAVLRLDANEQLIDEVLWAAMYSSNKDIRQEAFQLAAAKVVRQTFKSE